MTAPLYAIGRFCSRHHWPTIAVWLVLAVVLRRDRPGRRRQDQRQPDPARAPARPWRPNCSKTTCPNRPTAATRWCFEAQAGRS